MSTPVSPAAADVPYTGRLAAGVHLYAVRVYYEDTDAGGIVYHAGYLRFMERARTDLLSLCGIDLARAAETGEGQFVVAEAHIRYRRPARLGEALVIESRLLAVRGASCLVQQNVMRDGEEVVEGRMTIAFTGREGRPRRLPTTWTRALTALTGDAARA